MSVQNVVSRSQCAENFLKDEPIANIVQNKIMSSGGERKFFYDSNIVMDLQFFCQELNFNTQYKGACGHKNHICYRTVYIMMCHYPRYNTEIFVQNLTINNSNSNDDDSDNSKKMKMKNDLEHYLDTSLKSKQSLITAAPPILCSIFTESTIVHLFVLKLKRSTLVTGVEESKSNRIFRCDRGQEISQRYLREHCCMPVFRRNSLLSD
uniref:Uncharacterized protein n=1 Tax=Glossina pallidipes TaxID=7398 RepID=A0A1A9ZCF3_GLOPL